MLEAELKRKLRSLKKLEKRIRIRHLNRYANTSLVWDVYFSTTSSSRRSSGIKYPLQALLEIDRIQRKHIFEEYLYAVFLQHHKEEGFSIETFQDPAILSFLGLPYHATLADIKTRFRQLAHQHHPDKGGDPEKMIRLLEMYEKCFPKKRT